MKKIVVIICLILCVPVFGAIVLIDDIAPKNAAFNVLVDFAYLGDTGSDTAVVWGEGLALSTATLSVDTTEMVGNVIWDDGSTDASITWTWALSGADDPIFTIANDSITLDDSFTVQGTLEGATVTEGGNAVYSSGETPGGELGGTFASFTIDDSLSVTSWDLTTPTITTSLTTSTPTTISVAELDRLDGLAGIIVTDVTAVTDIEGTGLSIGGTTLNWSAASTDLTDTADLLYEAELDDFSELQAQIGDKTLINEEDAITLDALFTVALAGNTTILQNTTDAASNQVAQFKAGNRATSANDDSGYMSLFCDNDAGTQMEMARLKWIITQDDAASEEGALDIQLESSGGGDLQSILYLSHADSVALFDAGVKAPSLWTKDVTTGNYLTIIATANKYSADRILEINLSDGDRSLTLTRHIILDQDISISGSPTFVDLTLTGSLIIADANYIGSASDPDAILIEADGDVVLTQELHLTHSTGNYLKFGSNLLASIWCVNADFSIRNTNHGRDIELGAENAATGTLRTVILDPDVPMFGCGIAYDGLMDLGTATHQWKDFYIAGDAAIGGSVTIGVDAAGVESIRINSDAAGEYGLLSTITGTYVKLDAVGAILVLEGDNQVSINSTAGSIQCVAATYVKFETATAQSVIFDAGASFLFRDQDDSDNTRMSLDSATGDLKVYGVDEVLRFDFAGATGLLTVGSIYPLTDDTYYLGKNDDDTPFAWKGVILKDTTDGKYYRIEVINGTVTATDLTD